MTIRMNTTEEMPAIIGGGISKAEPGSALVVHEPKKAIAKNVIK